MESRKISLKAAKDNGYVLDGYTDGDVFYVNIYETIKGACRHWIGAAHVYYIGDYIEDINNITETERALLLLNLNIELVD